MTHIPHPGGDPQSHHASIRYGNKAHRRLALCAEFLALCANFVSEEVGEA